MAVPTQLSAAQMSFQAMHNDAVAALSSLYGQANSFPVTVTCASHYFDWEPAGFLFQCVSEDHTVQGHYWLATAVKGETLGLTPLSIPTIAFAAEVGTSISQSAYRAQEFVNIPADDQRAALSQAQQVFGHNTRIEIQNQ